MQNSNSNAGTEAPQSTNADEITSCQTIAKPTVICSACGAENSICWDKKEIGIDDKAGTWLTLELDFCQECGKVQSYSLS